MLDGLIGLGLWWAGAAWVRRFGWAWGVVGVWLNLLWFIYQNELGQGWLFYLRGWGWLFAGGGLPAVRAGLGPAALAAAFCRAFRAADAVALLPSLGRGPDAGGGGLFAGGAFQKALIQLGSALGKDRELLAQPGREGRV